MNSKIAKSTLVITAGMLLLGAGACSAASAAPQTVKVQKGDIAVTVASDGNLALINDRKITFQTSGTVKKVNFAEGDRVKAGDVLATLDTEPLELTISTASIAVEAAAIDLQTAKNTYEKITYPYSFSTFNLSVPDALNSMAEAQRNIDEIKNGTGDMATAAEKLKKATDALAAAKDKLKITSGQNPFASTQTVSIGGFSADVPTFSTTNFWTFRETELAVSKAQLGLDKANNDLKQATDQLPKTVITAPFDGILSQVNIKEGDNISNMDTSSKVVFYLVDPDNLELKGTVDEIDVARIAVGETADITLDAIPDTTITGELTNIAPVSRVEGGVVVYDVKIKIDNNSTLNLKSGMTAKAAVATEKKLAVLTLPERAIAKANGQTTVKVMAGDKLTDKPVAIGITDGTTTEILSGLAEGDEVVIEKKS